MNNWIDTLNLFNQFSPSTLFLGITNSPSSYLPLVMLTALILGITILLAYMYFQLKESRKELKHIKKILKESNENNLFSFFKKNLNRFKKAASFVKNFF